jgi:molybdenum cofactor cytidylyltransferase
MDKALCQPSEQIRGRPRFNLSTSLKLAIAALPAPRATPLFGSSLIDRLIDAFDAAPVEPLAAVPARGGRRGNPVLFGHALFPAVRMLEGGNGARDPSPRRKKIFSN